MASRLIFDDHARVLVRLVAHGGDVGDDFFVHQVGNPLHQHGAVHVIGDLGDDNLLAAAFELLEADLAAHLHAAAAGGEIIFDPLHAADRAAGRKIRPFDVLHQLFDGDVGIINLRANAIDDLAQVVRRHVGGHADGDARAAVDQQVRETRRERRSARCGSRRSSGRNPPCPCPCPPSAPRRAAPGALRCTAWTPGGSPSTEPKFPCPSTSRSRMAQGCAMCTSVG